jgi:hypothetical protein
MNTRLGSTDSSMPRTPPIARHTTCPVEASWAGSSPARLAAEPRAAPIASDAVGGVSAGSSGRGSGRSAEGSGASLTPCPASPAP